MNCKVIAIPSFRKDAKRLLKKYVSLKHELSVLGDQLLLTPRMGILLHENTYKIKIAVKSKGKGKSGGLRVVSHVVELEVAVDEDETQQTVTVFLLTIYDKSEMENISDGDLKWLVAEASAEVGGE